jgi:UDP-2,3-diacylglucosamine hydrolase
VSILFISDLHLPLDPSPLRETFLKFCSGPARAAAVVYILGDLFEYWIGDDIGLRDYAPEVRALRELTDSGVAVHFMHGNRDFLIGADFARATGLRIEPDPVVIKLLGHATLISHGDRYCTDDIGYQRWRRFARNPGAQAVFLRLPVAWRMRIAGRVRSTSLVEKRSKAEDIMDVNDPAIRTALVKYGVTRMIHGHTHRPADHRLQIDGQRCERIVLADWRPERMEYLQVDGRGQRRIRLS